MNQNLYEQYHKQLPKRIREWLNRRGIKDEIINRHKIGWDGRAITIPIFNIKGEFLFFKFRKDPENINKEIPKYWYESGNTTELYGWENLKNNRLSIVICEGELDRLLLESEGIPALTSTGGANAFKEEWVEYFRNIPEIFICYDIDESGFKGAERVAKLIPNARIIILPEMGINPLTGEKGKDITDFFQVGKDIDDFKKLMANAKTLPELEKENEEKIIRIQRATTNFPPLSTKELTEILGLTVKRDEENKIITFLCMISAYTENSQFNISYNAPSSTGKSYIPLEIAQLFPKEDIKKTGYASPTAFFHEKGIFIKELGGYEIDLERKILIFLDQPHSLLLAHLRPLLSHDDKVIALKITDKTQKWGLKTKNILIKGFPSVIFCTGNLNIDEQEATRMILLSPETTPEKIQEAILKRVEKESDPAAYSAWLESDERRKELKKRIQAIKDAKIRYVIIPQTEKIYKQFLSRYKFLKPRHTRDISRLMSLIKSLALLNLWCREYKGRDIIANEEDIDEAFRIWDKISESQELSIPPYIYRLYQEVIIPAWKEKGDSLSRQEIIQKHLEVYGRPLPDWQLRRQILPMLESAGLIMQESDPDDKRRILISPVYFYEKENKL